MIKNMSLNKIKSLLKHDGQYLVLVTDNVDTHVLYRVDMDEKSRLRMIEVLNAVIKSLELKQGEKYD